MLFMGCLTWLYVGLYVFKKVVAFFFSVLNAIHGLFYLVVCGALCFKVVAFFYSVLYAIHGLLNLVLCRA